MATIARALLLERVLPGLFFFAFAAIGLLNSDKETSLQWARAIVNTSFIGMVGYLYLVRRPRMGERASRLGAIVAVGGTFAPLVLAAAPARDHETLLVIGTVVTTIGLATSFVALATLGRCFGMFPEARGLVTRGPYRWVRHPLYLGEGVAVGGIVISLLSPVAVLIYVGFLALQGWRAVNEERALAAVFPEYEAYSQRTARVVPYAW